MHEQITQWLNILSIKRRPYTVSQYEYHLRTLDKTAPERQASDWTTAQLAAYLANKRTAGFGNSASKQWVGAVRSFFAWACGQASPARLIPYPKLNRRLQRTLDTDTMFKVLTSCDTSTLKGSRDLALLTLMLDTGLRAFEICALKVRDLDLEHRRLKVVVKGGNEEAAIFSKTTASNLSRWIAYRPHVASMVTPEVFVSIGGLTPGLAITSSGLRVLFRAIGRRAGLSQFSPHDLRRTMATLATRNGAPTRVVQAAGRWNDITMVQQYTAAIQAEDFEKYSPVESVMGKPSSFNPDKQ